VSRGFYPAIAGEARGKAVEAMKIEINIAKLIFEGRLGLRMRSRETHPRQESYGGRGMGRDRCDRATGMHCQAPKRTDAGGRRLAASPHRGLTQLSLSWLRLG